MTAAETTPEITPELRRSAGWVVALGFIQIIIGIMAIATPLVAGVLFAYFVGAALLIGGVIQVVYATRAASWGAGLLSVVGGVLAIVAGAIVIAHPIFGLKFLTLLLMIFFAADGVARIVLSLAMRPRHGWGWNLFVGIVSLLLAVLIWRQWPESPAWLIGTLIGIQILFVGWTHVALGVAARAASDTPPSE